MQKNIHIKKKHAGLVPALYFVTILLSVQSISAQQVPRYSQYIMNEFLVNPAVAGIDGMTVANLTGRMEWVGFSDGSPKTYSCNIQARLLKRGLDVKSQKSGNKLIKSRKGRVGIGCGVISDNNGAFSRVGISGTYAYHIYLENSQLSFGLTGSLSHLRILDKKIEFNDEGDRMEGLTGASIWIPDFAAGINYMTPDFHIGLSSVQLTESKLHFGNTQVQLQSTEISYNRNYFILLAYRNSFTSNRDWEFEVSAIAKSNDKFSAGIKAQTDLSGRLIYNKAYWFGAGYRTSKDVILLFGMRFNSLYLTYSFDYGTNALSGNSYGSHELSLTLKYGDTARRFPWLERY